jgi:hypothetical protein
MLINALLRRAENFLRPARHRSIRSLSSRAGPWKIDNMKSNGKKIPACGAAGLLTRRRGPVRVRCDCQFMSRYMTYSVPGIRGRECHHRRWKINR